MLTLVMTMVTPFSVNQIAAFPKTQVLAQTPSDQKAEADRLLNQGLEQIKTSQFEAALKSWQQALMIYRAIKDRQSEGYALGNLGIAYRHLGEYAKAIDYEQQYLEIARAIKDRQSEGKALGNLGLAYDSLGEYAKAIDYQQSSLWRSPAPSKTAKVRGRLWGIWDLLTIPWGSTPKPLITNSSLWRSPEP